MELSERTKTALEAAKCCGWDYLLLECPDKCPLSGRNAKGNYVSGICGNEFRLALIELSNIIEEGDI